MYDMHEWGCGAILRYHGTVEEMLANVEGSGRSLYSHE